ncbi:MAG: hypothetical protein ABII18_03075 [bacterium]
MDLVECFQDNEYLPENNVMIPAFILFRTDGRFVSSLFGRDSDADLISQLEVAYNKTE